jgi:nicotinamidase-related amidase
MMAVFVPRLSRCGIVHLLAWPYDGGTSNEGGLEMSENDVVRGRRAALVVIDVQESFRHMPFWSDVDLPSFRAALLRLEAGCRQRGVPVVHVFHVESRPVRSATASGHVHALDWLPGPPDACFFKHTHNAFSDTGLDLHLRRLRIERLIIAGIRTEQCCETTTRVGSDIGYEVDFVSEATLTFADDASASAAAATRRRRSRNMPNSCWPGALRASSASTIASPRWEKDMLELRPNCECLRSRSAARLAGSDDLFLRMHLLCRLCRHPACRALSQLRRRVAAPADSPGGQAGTLSGVGAARPQALRRQRPPATAATAAQA